MSNVVCACSDASLVARLGKLHDEAIDRSIWGVVLAEIRAVVTRMSVCAVALVQQR